jgi:hypothetical protein
MKDVLIIDPNHIDGMINAKMITHSLARTRALSFTGVQEAHEFSKKYNISPSLILVDDSFSELITEIRAMLEDCESNCQIHLMSESQLKVVGATQTSMESDSLIDQVSAWLA